jgi:hypothetical protein
MRASTVIDRLPEIIPALFVVTDMESEFELIRNQVVEHTPDQVWEDISNLRALPFRVAAIKRSNATQHPTLRDSLKEGLSVLHGVSRYAPDLEGEERRAIGQAANDVARAAVYLATKRHTNGGFLAKSEQKSQITQHRHSRSYQDLRPFVSRDLRRLIP